MLPGAFDGHDWMTLQVSFIRSSCLHFSSFMSIYNESMQMSHRLASATPQITTELLMYDVIYRPLSHELAQLTEDC